MFSFQKPYFLGIDFGTSYIKATELTLNEGRVVLSNYGYIEMRFTEGKNAVVPTLSPEKLIHDHLEALLHRFAPRSKSINLALPGFSGLITLIELPDMNDEDLKQAIQFEAQKYIPSPLGEVAFSWEVLSRKKSNDASKKKMMEVLLVAALRKEVTKYEHIVAGIRLPIDLLEIEIFPLVRAVAEDFIGTVLLVDIGSRVTNIVLVGNGDVRLNRSVNAGGNEITSTLAEGLHISWDRAEEMKRGSKDFLTDPKSAIVFSGLDLITSEVSRIFAMCSTKGPENLPHEIILSGGTAKMKGLSEYFSSTFRVPVSIANPWKNISFPEPLRPIIANTLGPSFSIAVGLALGGIERYRKK